MSAKYDGRFENLRDRAGVVADAFGVALHIYEQDDCVVVRASDPDARIASTEFVWFMKAELAKSQSYKPFGIIDRLWNGLRDTNDHRQAMRKLLGDRPNSSRATLMQRIGHPPHPSPGHWYVIPPTFYMVGPR